MNNTRQDGYFRKVEIDELPGKVRVILMKIKDYGAEILTKAMREELYSAGVILFLNPDAVNPDRLDDLRCMGYSFYDSYPNTSISENLICQGQYLDRTMKRFTFTLYDRRGLPQRIFGTREILRQVGPLPKPDELIRFPNPKCAASIPNISKRCQWCGEEIRDGRGD